MTKQLLWTR